MQNATQLLHRVTYKILMVLQLIIISSLVQSITHMHIIFTLVK